MRGSNQQRLERRTIPFAPRHGKCTQRVAVITLAACNEMLSLRLANVDKILSRHFQCCFDRFRSIANKIGVADACRRTRHQRLGERLGDLGGKETAVRIREFFQLRAHRRQYVRVAVAEARDRCAAGSIDILAPVAVVKIDTLAAYGHGQVDGGVALEDSGHGVPVCRLFYDPIFSAIVGG